MAAKGWIYAVIFICCMILPLVASAEEASHMNTDNNGENDDSKNSVEEASELNPANQAFMMGNNNATAEGFVPWENVLDATEQNEGKKKKKGKKNKNKDEDDNENENEKEEQQAQTDFSESKAATNVGNKGGLAQGFYAKSCPRAEEIIKEVTNKAFQEDATQAAALLRLFSHDCFVTGCDASILLDQTPSGQPVEKKADPNGEFIGGMDLVDTIKAELEKECPGVVSCADTLAYATRDAVVFSGIPNYDPAGGRRDGLVSEAKNVDGNVLVPTNTFEQMKQTFERKGLTLEDLAILIGSHSIGHAHCTNFLYRAQDRKKAADIDPRLLTVIFFTCGNIKNSLPFDSISQYQLDSSFYSQVLNNRALLETDHLLAVNPQTSEIMKKYADDQKGWAQKFVESMIKMGQIEVLTGDKGEIRKNCRAVNGQK